MALHGDASTTSRRLPAVLAALGVAVYAAIASTTKALTWQASLAVTIPVVIVAVAAMRRPPNPITPTRALRRGKILWGLVFSAAILWEAWNFFHQSAWNVGSLDYPTLSVLLGPFLGDPLIRYAAWCLWLAIGWRVLRR